MSLIGNELTTQVPLRTDPQSSVAGGTHTHGNALRAESSQAACAVKPVVTVMVPIRNEERFIQQTLQQILEQDSTGLELEICVVDGGSTDRTRELVQAISARDPRVVLYDNPRRLSSAARNVAIKHGKGDWLVLIDGHCQIPSRRYLLDLVQAFKETGADCLGRPQPLDVTGANLFQQAVALARSSPVGHHPESFIYSDQPQRVPAKSVAIAYRRQVFEQLGGFDESFDAHEDGEFNYRCDQAGMSCYLVPALAVKYFPRSTVAGLFKQIFRYGRGRVRFSRKHPGTWGLGTLIPAALVVYLALGPLFALLLPWAGWAYLVGLGLYVTTLLIATVLLTGKCRALGVLARVPLVFLTVHLGAGLGILSEWLFPRIHNRQVKTAHQ